MDQLMKTTITLIHCVLLLSFIGPAAEAQVKKMKIYISVDMEGVAGTVTGDQLSPSGFEYQRFREFMTQEANAAIEGAFAAGATEVVVSDSHGNAQNLLIEKIPKNVLLVRGFPRPLVMMQGIDETFDGVIFLGYHSSTDNPDGVRSHTFSSARLTGVRLNNISMSEGSFNAAIAGHFNVPVIAVSGDEAAVKEVSSAVGEVEGAVVKWSYGFHSAKTMVPDAACALIEEKVKAAIRRIKDFKPYKLKTPVQLDVRFKNYRPSELLSYLSTVERTDSHSIRFIGRDMIEISKFMEFIMSYEPGLEP
jgi:D-amino peptidase